MKTLAKLLIFILTLVAAAGNQSCTTGSGEPQATQKIYQESSTNDYLDICLTSRQECLNLINQHSSEIARIVQAQNQNQDPAVLDVLSSVYFASELETKENQIKQECPSVFEEYESERNTLIALLIAKEAAKAVLR